MSDILFDLQNNDVGISDGDFATVVDPSVQNATLMLLKNPVNILQPQFGVGFEMFALNARPEYVSSLAAAAKRQVLKDGADYCDITITEGEKYGEYSVAVDAQYPIDEIPSGTVEVQTKTSRGYEIRIILYAVPAIEGEYVSGATVKINLTKPDGSQTDWLPPTEISDANGYDVYIFKGEDGVTLKQVTMNVNATKTGYQELNNQQTISAGYDDVFYSVSIAFNQAT